MVNTHFAVMNPPDIKTIILPFDWSGIVDPQQRQYIAAIGLRESDLVDAYLTYRRVNGRELNTDMDFSRYHEHVHTFFEDLYETMNYGDDTPCFGCMGLTAHLVIQLPTLVELSWRWGEYVWRAMHSVDASNPYRYIDGSAEPAGHSGVAIGLAPGVVLRVPEAPPYTVSQAVVDAMGIRVAERPKNLFEEVAMQFLEPLVA